MQAHEHPFAFFTSEEALPEPVLQWLDGLFEQPRAWDLHADSFYRAWLSDVPELDADLRRAVIARFSELTGVPLADRVRLTVQRMEPGQYALPHTDRPLLGYEGARLVVHLNPGWRAEDGGALRIHSDAEGLQTHHERLPERNGAFGFVMGPNSWHSVQTMTRTRRAAVFNLFHAANTPELAQRVRQELEGLHFADLPASLDALIDQAEQERPLEDSHRAGTVAWLLQKWGAHELVVPGYRAALEPLDADCTDQGVLLRARWFERLANEDFDAALWAALRPPV